MVTGLGSFQGLMEEVSSEEKIKHYLFMRQAFQIEEVTHATRITL